jgi:hypothetical protein
MVESVYEIGVFPMSGFDFPNVYEIIQLRPPPKKGNLFRLLFTGSLPSITFFFRAIKRKAQ